MRMVDLPLPRTALRLIHPPNRKPSSLLSRKKTVNTEHALGLAVLFEPGIICNFSFQAGTLDFLTEN